MPRVRIRSIPDVARAQMCTGCGVCAYLSPAEIEMGDVTDHGRRPRPTGTSAGDPRSDEAFAACPGTGLERRAADVPEGAIPGLLAAWGPVLEVWEGFATDTELRHAASSGGASSALALHGITSGALGGLLHTAARADRPWHNHTVFSTTRAEVLAATGSRYAPASPCDGLERIESAAAPCAFIGKPCDVAAAHRARELRPGLDARLGLTIAVFCAGTPSTRGTLEMIEAMGVDDLKSVRSVRYRGRGWPGHAAVEFDGPTGPQRRELTYRESWGEILQRHRAWRCHVCADHTGEFADVSVGDPWYREIPADEPGRSLILARSERGRAAVRAAAAAGALHLEPADPGVIAASQPNLLRARGNVWARTRTSRALGAAAPTYRGLPTFRFWLRELDWRAKAQSILGTARRVFRRRLRHPTPLSFEDDA